MNSRIYTGELMHTRLEPVKHAFRYPVYFYSFDVDELPHLEKQCSFFGHNRFRPVSLHDKDYLGNGGGNLRSKVEKFLHGKEITDKIAKIELVTSARYFNYVFNPASFFYCYSSDGDLRAVIAEVHNTFKEAHLYVLDAKKGFRAEKEFHVSPFFDLKGEYDFQFSDIREKADIWVNLIKQGKPSLLAQMTGVPKPFNTRNLLATILRFPLNTLLTMPRIMWQAAKLHYVKKLPVFHKPAPFSPMTIKSAPANWIHKICMMLIFRVLSQIEIGILTVILPNGEKKDFKGSVDGLHAVIEVKDFEFFCKLVRDGDIGFGESYTNGDWLTPDLTVVLKLFFQNTDAFNEHHLLLSKIGIWINKARHAMRKNTIEKSRENIQEHYDLGNNFFRLFLDNSLMMYSCAFYKNPAELLEEAQKNKVDMIIEKAGIHSGDHVLEVGSGWGGFAIRAVQKTGCRVTTITLSKEQHDYVEQKVRELGLENSIEVKICDYRHVRGSFDKIVSIEMLEAVGHEYYGTFFNTLDRLLKPGGRIVIQTITITDAKYNDYRKDVDWIQKHIFPGGNLPALGVLSNSLSLHSQLSIAHVEDIGLHYARTLHEWRDRFNANWPEIEKLGFDAKFKRTWNYYFAYCEVGFATRHIGDLQILLERKKNS